MDFDPIAAVCKQLEAEFVSFDTLLMESDFVIAACPLTSETKEMFNEKAFNKMKKTAVFVNVGRGEVVDQPAMVKALKNKTIFAAGLDVVTPEPLPKDHELLQLPNCGPQLKIVCTMSASIDHIDAEALKARGIKLCSAPAEMLNSSVANIAILLVLATSRRLHEGRLSMENGFWKPGIQSVFGQDIDDSTVGIVGLGGIGQAIVKKLKPFHVKKFLYCGRKEKEEGKQLQAEFVSFDKLLEESDFVIAACPLTSETKEMFNEKAFKKMKKTAIFVNVARGAIVDQPAMINALKTKTIFAAGLDVMTPEPLPEDHELLQLPNCVLLPHCGSATSKTRVDMAELAAKNIILGLTGEPLLTPIY